MRRLLLVLGAVLAVGFLAIQLVPYGRDHTNPPITGEPAWATPETRAIAVRACFDCHSNETVWPWYSTIAPLSWRLQAHVDEGREELNFSEWGRGEQETDEIVEVVRERDMPPWDYLPLHPEANLSDAERPAFLDGLVRTFGAGEGGGNGEDAADD